MFRGFFIEYFLGEAETENDNFDEVVARWIFVSSKSMKKFIVNRELVFLCCALISPFDWRKSTRTANGEID